MSTLEIEGNAARGAIDDFTEVDGPLIDSLSREIVRARRMERSISIILFHLGDAETDNAAERRRRLKRVLAKVAEGLRHTDICGRLSERAILSILPGANEAGARSAASRLSGGALSGRMRGSSGDVFIGVAEYDLEGGAEEVIRRARKDLQTVMMKEM